MPLDPGAILFTSVFTSNAAAPEVTDETFSFIATETIPAGTVIRFWDSDTSPSYVDYTVGAGGLAPLDRVTIAEDGNVFSLLNDPSGGSVGALQNGGSWTLSTSEPIVATSQHGASHEVIAGFGPNDTWDENLASLVPLGVSRSLIDAYTGSPSPVLSSVVTGGAASSTNLMFAGADLADYDDLTMWVGESGNISHTAPNISGTTYGTQDSTIFCFAEGTLIAVPGGERAVETLLPGDRVLTADGREVAAIWIGRQSITRRFHGERAQLVRIEAGVLGNHTELFVTGDHGMVLDGLVINASALVNGDSIAWVPLSETPDRFTVYHVETEEHDVILANGAATESFVDYDTRRRFDNFAEYSDLHGHDRAIPESPLPRISATRHVPQDLRQRLGLAGAA